MGERLHAAVHAQAVWGPPHRRGAEKGRQDMHEKLHAAVIGVVRRKNDAEDKLIAAPEGVTFTKEEMGKAVFFQEQWFDTEIIL